MEAAFLVDEGVAVELVALPVPVAWALLGVAVPVTGAVEVGTKLEIAVEGSTAAAYAEQVALGDVEQPSPIQIA